jgi:hypothetical protein
MAGAAPRHGVLPGFAGVDHDGLAGLGGDFQLALEDRALHVARREIVVVVEADLADGQHLGMAARSRRRAKVSGVALEASCGCTPMVA